MTKKNTQQNIKKYAVFTGMFLICAGIIGFIFFPADEQESVGLNMDIPQPKKDEIISDKKSAYELDRLLSSKKNKMQTLEDLKDLFGNEEKEILDIRLNEDTQNAPSSNIKNSVLAHQEINRSLHGFYQKDYEKERLQQKVSELQSQLRTKNNPSHSLDEKVALMEKSYELATKYFPQEKKEPELLKDVQTNEPELKKEQERKERVQSHKEMLVSSLSPYLTEEEINIKYNQPRNYYFHSIDSPLIETEKNTIRACIHDNQKIVSGQSVKLRLLETIEIRNHVIPKNAIITGYAKVQGERLQIDISTIENNQVIIPVEMTAHDIDGQKGIYIPNLMGISAVKETIAGMGNTAGTSITISKNASSQIASDLSKGAIQGISKFTSKKLTALKVNLKANYQLFLISKK